MSLNHYIVLLHEFYISGCRVYIYLQMRVVRVVSDDDT